MTLSKVRLALAGSECLADEEGAQLVVLKAITHWQQQAGPGGLTVVVTGAVGIDRIAARIARYREVPVEVHEAQESRWGGPAGYQAANHKVAKSCTHLLKVACPGSTAHGAIWTARQAGYAGAVVLPPVEVVCAEHAAILNERRGR